LLEVTSPQDESERVEVQVSGVYRVDDVEDPFWWGRALETDGREQVSFTTFGPLVVSEAAFFELGRDRAEVRWRAAPRVDAIGVGDLDRLRLDVDGFEDRLNSTGRVEENLIVRTGLGNVLVLELLELVGLAGRAKHRPYELSGGEQQRVAICRALANRPRLLIADEPTAQLDSGNALTIMELVRELVASEGVSAIVATHDPLLLDVADEIVELRDGRIAENGR
jgi:hypothetical protein